MFSLVSCQRLNQRLSVRVRDKGCLLKIFIPCTLQGKMERLAQNDGWHVNFLVVNCYVHVTGLGSG